MVDWALKLNYQFIYNTVKKTKNKQTVQKIVRIAQSYHYNTSVKRFLLLLLSFYCYY